MFCTVHCNEGFGFVDQPEALYVCSPKGAWINAGKGTPSLPDCSSKRRCYVLNVLFQTNLIWCAAFSSHF